MRVHALRHLDLMQPQPAARAGDQHRLPRLDLRDAERRAHAGADRADRERRRLHVEAIRHADGVARGRAGELGVAAAAALAQHAAVAAEILPAAQAIAALPAIEPLVDHHALAVALGRHVRAGLDDLARDLVAEDAARLAARNLAAAREHVVIADAGGMDANQHVVGPGLRPLDVGRLQHRRRAEIREGDGFHRCHGDLCTLGEGGCALLEVVLGLDEVAHGRDLGLLGLATAAAGTAPAAWSPAPRPANRTRSSPPTPRASACTSSTTALTRPMRKASSAVMLRASSIISSALACGITCGSRIALTPEIMPCLTSG